MDRTANDKKLQAALMADISATLETVGKVQSSRLVEKRVFPASIPGFTSQVKLSYDTKSEKGDWTELFAWNIKDSREAVLADYQIMPKTNQPESEK